MNHQRTKLIATRTPLATSTIDLVPHGIANEDLPRLFVGYGTQVPVLRPDADGRPEIVSQRYANLDQAASTPILKALVAKLIELQLIYSNIERGDGRLSLWLSELHERAREMMAELLGAKGYHVEFVRNFSEGSNLAARFLEPTLTKDDVIFTTDLEHHSNLLPWWEMAKRVECTLVQIGITADGEIDQADFTEQLTKHRKNLKLVAISGGSNVSGAITDIEFFKREVAQTDAILFVDGSQLTGHRSVVLSALEPTRPRERVHIYVTAGHKHYQNLGSSVLLIDPQLYSRVVRHPRWQHPMPGGDTVLMVDRESHSAAYSDRLVAGTPNIIPDILSAASLHILTHRIGWDAILRYEHALIARFREGLEKLNAEIRDRIGGHARITVKGVPLDAQERGGVFDLVLYGKDGRPFEDTYVAARASVEYGVAGRPLCHCAIPAEEVLAGCHADPDRDARVERLGTGSRTAEDLFGAYRLSAGIANSFQDIDQGIEALRAIYFKEPVGTYVRHPNGKYSAQELPPSFGIPVDITSTTFDWKRLFRALMVE